MYHIEFKDLILNIINQLIQNRIGFGKTRLVKLAYLVEVEHYRLYKEKLTDPDWIYYKFGPYINNFDNYLLDPNIIVEDRNDEFTKIQLKEDAKISNISSSILGAIKNIIEEFGKMDFKKLLNYVYYETEPMINVKERGENLDFSTILPEAYYEIKEFRNLDEIKKRLRKKFKKQFGNSGRI